MYTIIGNITYNNTNSKTAALSALQTVIANYPELNPITTTESAGLNENGLILTISYEIPDTSIESFRQAFSDAWGGQTRTRVYVGIVKV